MAGLHAEIRTLFAQSAQNYIMASRIAQGKEDYKNATHEERDDIEKRWLASRDDLKTYYNWRQKEKGKGPDSSPRRPFPVAEASSATDGLAVPTEAPKTGWKHTKNLSWDERKRLQEQKKAWEGRQAAAAAGLASGSHVTEDVNAARLANQADRAESQDPEFEQAIQLAVRETSNGDEDEDAKIEQAIRHSVRELRRRSTLSLASKVSNQLSTQPTGSSSDASEAETRNTSHYGFPSEVKGQIPFSPEDFENITDEEYQALIEQAVQLSIADDHRKSQQTEGVLGRDDDEKFQQALKRSQTDKASSSHVEDAELRKAMEASEAEHAARSRQGSNGQDDDDDEELKRAIAASQAAEAQGRGAEDEEEFKRALEASQKEHQEELARAKANKTEEEIVMEYVKKQSLAEAQFQQKGKGTETSAHEDDEDLKRAIEESMRASGKAGESSGSGSGAGPASST